MPPTKTFLAGADVFTVSQFLSINECEQLVRYSESIGYEPATVSTVAGAQYLPGLRDNYRVIVDDPARGCELWDKARLHIPQSIEGWRAVGVNERFRFYRYEDEQQFDWHTDGYYERENGERSFLTFMLYLNDDFDGGETAFMDNRESPEFAELDVTPATGLALFFVHPLLHKGNPVLMGRKYVLRSDIMYRRV